VIPVNAAACFSSVRDCVAYLEGLRECAARDRCATIWNDPTMV
jgi:hypothetical protein